MTATLTLKTLLIVLGLVLWGLAAFSVPTGRLNTWYAGWILVVLGALLA